MERSERVNYLCRAFGRIHRSMLRGNRRGPELRPSEAGALWTIDHAGDGGIHPSEVSRRMSIARPSLTPILRELEAKGLIRRLPDPAAGRRCLLAATERFRAEQQIRWREHTRLMEKTLSCLSDDETEILCGLLHKIEEALPDRYEERISKEDGR